jgi:hypothetical protein
MKKRSVGIMLVLALVLVMSFVVVANASAAIGDPVLTSVSPTTMSNTTYGSQDLTIRGVNLDAFIGDPEINLYQTSAPYDTISGDYYWTSTGAIYCGINTYGESAGQYTVEVGGLWRIGQVWPEYVYLTNALSITGVSPVQTPVIASVSPNKKDVGSAAFTMTVYGYNFGTGGIGGAVPTVYWNDTALPTSTGSSTLLTATVPASLLTTAGTASIVVRNVNSSVNPPTTVVSNSVPFTVNALLPTLISINPTSGWAKYYQPYLIQLNGTNFQPAAQVLVNGVVHASTYVSASQLTMQLTAADIAGPGTLNISVRNGSGQQPTNTVAFTLQADTLFPISTITGADDNWHNTPVTLTVTATEAIGPGVQSTYYGIGVPATIVLSGSTITVPAPAGGAGDGAQVVSVYSTDKCGNIETPVKTVTVYICTLGPDTDVFAPSSVKKGKTCKIQYEADSITPTTTNIMKIYKSNGSVAKSFNMGQQNSNKEYTKSFTCNLAPGNYKVKLFATDAAGNQQSSQHSDSFQVTK